MRHRTTIVIILLGTIIYVPWWLSVGFIFFAVWQFNSRYELLLPTMIADLAYSTPLIKFFSFAFPATFFTFLIIASIQVLANQFFLKF